MRPIRKGRRRWSDGLPGSRVVLAVVVAWLALLAAACSPDGGDAAAAADAEVATSGLPAADDGPAVPSPGCSTGTTGDAVRRGRTDQELATRGTTRTYRRLVPAAYEPGVPAALVVDLHGLTMTDDLEAALTGFEDLADDEGFVVVTPQGVGDIPFWNFVSSGTAADDVAFLGDLVEQVGVDLCIDTTRVYASGISNGGLMSSALACRLPDVFAAVAPVAGVTFLPACESGPPVGYQAIYGTHDDVLPYDGGLSSDLRGYLTANPIDESRASVEQQDDEISGIAFASVDDTLANWAARNECAAEPVEERVSGEVVRRSWPDCAEGGDVVLYVVEGGGHTWPGTPLLGARDADDGASAEADTATGGLASVAGRTTDDISATDLAWEFFQRHQRDP